MHARIKYVCSLTHRIFYGSVHELALTRFIVCLRRQFVHYVINHNPRAFALYCLLTQTGCSLMGLKKTNAAFAALVFFGTHYIINTFILKCYWIFCQM